MSVTTESNENLPNSTNFGGNPTVATTVNTERGVYSGALCNISGLDADTGTNRRSSVTSSIDSNDPAVRRVVYNLYRGLLGTYNDKANDILSNVPAERVREDQGISKQVESMIKQSLETKNSSSGPKVVNNDLIAPVSNETYSAGMAAPPPPPPMPTNGSLPSIKLNSEIGIGTSSSNKGGKQIPGGGVPFSYIPPAAIQNAMMTKDKKPFTYTPGGIDLSEIRSPRMQRRISKNAADEGIANVAMAPQGANLTPHLTPQALAAMQPQISVPVFPPQPPPPPSSSHMSSHIPESGQSSHSSTPVFTPPSVSSPTVTSPPPPTLKSTFQMSGSNPVPSSLTPPSTSQFSPSFQRSHSRVEPDSVVETELNKLQESNASTPNGSQNTTPQVIQQGPFVERRNVQVGSIYVPPVTVNNSISGATPPTAQLSKAPMPWMNSQNRFQSQSPPPFVPQLSPFGDRFGHREDSVPLTTAGSQVRMIPIAIEGQDQIAESREHLYQRNASVREDTQQQVPWQTNSARVIPIHLEASIPVKQTSEPTLARTTSQMHQQQHPPWRTAATCSNNQTPISSMMEDLNIASHSSNGRQEEPGSIQYNRSLSQQPTQSRSFRILQMITDTGDEGTQDAISEPNESGRVSRSSVSSGGSGTLGKGAQLNERRLVLTQEDRDLMDMFRSQVNEEHFLHQEVDPRYRGSHIPSRAFRILQNFTDSSEVADVGSQQHTVVRQQNSNPAQDARNVGVSSIRKQPSEQSEPEPRKYMGSSIPSRSFRLLQAMTADPNGGQSDL